MKFVVYNKSTGKILRSGHCQDRAFSKQAQEGEEVLEGVANDVRQKIVAGKIVDKTSEEIERDNPKRKRISFEKRRANISNEQYQNLLQRIERLEKA